MVVLPVLPYTVLNVISPVRLHPFVHNFCSWYRTVKWWWLLWILLL